MKIFIPGFILLAIVLLVFLSNWDGRKRKYVRGPWTGLPVKHPDRLVKGDLLKGPAIWFRKRKELEDIDIPHP